ncbi:MAG: YggS family pyridoxal phosphate-dependent enzyme [Planctomycetota bacterium]|nr:YggS family pyridoxal phosphate-dependent enzyme [Planctomycetota bacterium]
MSHDVSEQLAAVHERIAVAARRAAREPSAITLVGVSKRQPQERVVAAVAAGLRHLGENFAQEARDKRPALLAALAERGAPAPRWHFIGQLQRNKARLVAPHFDLVESVDRESLAVALDRRAGEAGRTLDVLLQVNLSGEAQKGGVREEELPRLLAATAPLPHLRVTGLMGVPAAGTDPEQARPAFARLRALRDTLSSGTEGGTLQELSMGMSGDFEVAIEEGATIVRVGTAIFGPREN